MVGILVELFFSALLLWLLYKQSLLVLGIAPDRERLAWLLGGFLVAAATCISYHLLISLFTTAHWSSNPGATPLSLASSSWWTLRSVLFEELLFRGALLYIAIQKWGAKRACIASAIAFGVYHWFSYGALGNPVQMLFIFLMTGIWGFMFAVAFARTRSLYLPIALHFGWNWVHTVVFSQGPLGKQLLVASNTKALEGVPSLLLFLFQVFALPLLVLLYLRWRSRREGNLEPAAG